MDLTCEQLREVRCLDGIGSLEAQARHDLSEIVLPELLRLLDEGAMDDGELDSYLGGNEWFWQQIDVVIGEALDNLSRPERIELNRRVRHLAPPAGPVQSLDGFVEEVICRTLGDDLGRLLQRSLTARLGRPRVKLVRREPLPLGLR